MPFTTLRTPPTMNRRPTTRRFAWIPIATVLVGILHSPALAAPQSSATSGGAAGRIEQGSVDVYRFSPEETWVEADAERTSLRALLESLGEETISWYQHVMTLSNPYFEGRAPGSPGIERAADYLAYWLDRSGLEPAFAGAFRQAFELPLRTPETIGAGLAIGDETLREGEDFLMLANSGAGEVVGSVAFVGYGIEDGPEGFDSFGDMGDLSGRVAMVFRYEPIDEEGNSRFAGRRFSRHAALAGKFGSISKRGASAILLVNPPGVSGGANGLDRPRRGGLGPTADIPVLMISPEAAERILNATGGSRRSMEAWRRMADEGEVANVNGPANVAVTVELRRSVETSNVAGVLPGAGPLADEWLVVGGHYDHLGETEDEDGGVEINPGADDNASGTAAMLVLADRFSRLATQGELPASRRSVLFIAFTAEERGLNGSRHFMLNPTVPADAITTMVNLDMIGRLRNDELLVAGVGSGVGLLERIEPALADSGLFVRADPNGRGPSDHSNFFGAGIPVLFFFTGVHESYHQPGDRGHTVHPAGARKVIDLVGAIVEDLMTGPAVEFARETPPPAQRTEGRGYAGVRLGVRPGLAEGEERGIVVQAVSDGTSAADAGILAGDVMIAWNGQLLIGAGDLAARLREHKPGDVVKILVDRDGEELEIDVELKASEGGARRGN